MRILENTDLADGYDPGVFENVGTAVKTWRLDAGLTQTDLANAANLSISTIQKLEAGKHQPERNTLRLVLQALRKTLEDLDAAVQRTPPIHLSEKAYAAAVAQATEEGVDVEALIEALILGRKKERPVQIVTMPKAGTVAPPKPGKHPSQSPHPDASQRGKGQAR